MGNIGSNSDNNNDNKNNNNKNQHNKNPLIIHIPSYPKIGEGEPNLVIPGLYISSAGTARDKQKLEECKITHILTAASAIFPKYVGDYNYMILEVQDWAGEDILYYFDEAIKFIDEARQNGGNVLVHCMAGISRSATIVIAYVMHAEKVTFPVAFKKLRKARPIIRPNGAFTRQLEIFERWIIGASPSLSFASKVFSEPPLAEIPEDKNKEEEMWELAMCKLLYRLEFLSGLGKRRRQITGEDPEVLLHKRVYSKISSTSNRLAPLYYFTDPADPRNSKEKEEKDEDDDDDATRVTPALMAALSVALDKQTKETENEEEEIEETQNSKRVFEKHTVWVWACVQCGRYLFTPLNITSISLPLLLSSTPLPSSSSSSSSSSSPSLPSLLSSPNMYYEIEGMEWMKELTSSGDIKCPNCFRKIGECNDEREGEKNNFGTIEDRPAFYVHKKDVERKIVIVEV